MSAAWPQVKNRLVVLVPGLFPSASGWAQGIAYNGPPVTGATPTNYVTVGFVAGEDFGGSYEQERGVGNMLEETGTVRCEVVCKTGDVNLPSMETQAFALVDAWEAEIARDQTLGVLAPSSTSSLSVDVQPLQTDRGTTQRLTVTLTYFSRS